MSKEKQELTVLEELEQDQAKYIQQREFAQNSLNQSIGAIFSNEQAIQKLKNEKLKKPYKAPKLKKLTKEEEEKLKTINKS